LRRCPSSRGVATQKCLGDWILVGFPLNLGIFLCILGCFNMNGFIWGLDPETPINTLIGLSHIGLSLLWTTHLGLTYMDITSSRYIIFYLSYYGKCDFVFFQTGNTSADIKTEAKLGQIPVRRITKYWYEIIFS